MLDVDLTTDAAGRATAFATGCAGAYVFVRNLVMRPAVKSCHQQIAELRNTLEWLKDQLERKDARIGQLETVLLTKGSGEIRAAMQAAISENHVETVQALGRLEAKLEKDKP